MNSMKALGYYAEGPWVVADYGGEHEPEALFAVKVEANAQVVADEWNALLQRAEAAEDKVKRAWTAIHELSMDPDEHLSVYGEELTVDKVLTVMSEALEGEATTVDVVIKESPK